MKKTLLALAVMAATSSVAANEIYSTDTSKLSLTGEIDAYLITDDVDDLAGGNKTTDLDVEMWAKIQVDAEHKINDTLTAFASFEIETDNQGESETGFDDVFIGVKTDVWGVAIGEVGDFADSMDAIQKDDITNEGNYMGSTDGHHTEGNGNGFVVKVEVLDGLVLVADVHTDEDEDVDNTYGVSANYAFSNYSIGASFVTGDAGVEDDNDDFDYATDYSVYGLSVSAEFGDLFLAATYAEFEGSQVLAYWDTANLSGSTVGVAASYRINKTLLYTTYAFADIDESAYEGGTTDVDEDISNLVVGASYDLLDNILLFAEYQVADVDFDDEGDLDAYTFIAGVYYTF